jgi:hypothetical protein
MNTKQQIMAAYLLMMSILLSGCGPTQYLATRDSIFGTPTPTSEPTPNLEKMGLCEQVCSYGVSKPYAPAYGKDTIPSNIPICEKNGEQYWGSFDEWYDTELVACIKLINNQIAIPCNYSGGKVLEYHRSTWQIDIIALKTGEVLHSVTKTVSSDLSDASECPNLAHFDEGVVSKQVIPRPKLDIIRSILSP